MQLCKLDRGSSGWMVLSAGLLATLAVSMVVVDRWFPSLASDPQVATSIEELGAVSGCDPGAGMCVAGSGIRRITLQFGSPIVPLEAFSVAVDLIGLEAEAVTIEFRMEGMEMGANRFVLAEDGVGRWRGEAVLPVCWTGRRQWSAVVLALAAGVGMRARFGFAVGS